MVLNRKGQTLFLGIMLAMLGVIAVIVMIEPLKQVIEIARDASHLNCDAAGLSVGTSMSCIVVDWILVAFVGIGLGVALAYIGIRSLRQGVQQ